MENSTSLTPLSFPTQEGWSLPAVKQALSHLRWQRDRLDHTSGSHGPDSPLVKTCSVVVDCALEEFNEQTDDYCYMTLDRVLILQHMLIQRQRALVGDLYSVHAYNNNYTKFFMHCIQYMYFCSDIYIL